jgi:hypothetical protein
MIASPDGCSSKATTAMGQVDKLNIANRFCVMSGRIAPLWSSGRRGSFTMDTLLYGCRRQPTRVTLLKALSVSMTRRIVGGRSAFAARKVCGVWGCYGVPRRSRKPRSGPARRVARRRRHVPIERDRKRHTQTDQCTDFVGDRFHWSSCSSTCRQWWAMKNRSRQAHRAQSETRGKRVWHVCRARWTTNFRTTRSFSRRQGR